MKKMNKAGERYCPKCENYLHINEFRKEDDAYCDDCRTILSKEAKIKFRIDQQYLSEERQAISDWGIRSWYDVKYAKAHLKANPGYSILSKKGEKK
jgi:hypothetical protein